MVCVVCIVLCVVGVGGGKGGMEKGRVGGRASTMVGGGWARCAVMCYTLVARNTRRNLCAEWSRNCRWSFRRLVSTQVPVVCVVCGVSCVVCVVWVGRWEGWEEKRDRQWWVGIGPYVLWCVPPWLSEIHDRTYGPNNRELFVGAFVAWCPPKYL